MQFIEAKKNRWRSVALFLRFSLFQFAACWYSTHISLEASIYYIGSVTWNSNWSVIIASSPKDAIIFFSCHYHTGSCKWWSFSNLMTLFALFIDLFRLSFLLDSDWNTILPACWALLIGMTLLHVQCSGWLPLPNSLIFIEQFSLWKSDTLFKYMCIFLEVCCCWSVRNWYLEGVDQDWFHFHLCLTCFWWMY